MQLARPDKSWDVEQQGGLADKWAVPKDPALPGTAGIQISWEVVWDLSCGRADNTGKAHEEMYPVIFFFFGLRCCSAAIATGEEKNLIFIVKKHGEIIFFQRNKVCSYREKKEVYLCVYFPVILLYLYIKRDN